MDQQQIATNKRLDNIEQGLDEVKEATRITRNETGSLHEDVHTIMKKIDVLKKK